ncbi:MAG: hypothetical protein J0G98_14010 [Terrimonas ferruginea]|nr:hypothetical protein [Terrimonas ferruginea]MBN8784170.1 hypothetical protein [Terrimonas ferruginea]
MFPSLRLQDYWDMPERCATVGIDPRLATNLFLCVSNFAPSEVPVVNKP